MSDCRVALGYVIGLDYSNPHINTFKVGVGVRHMAGRAERTACQHHVYGAHCTASSHDQSRPGRRFGCHVCKITLDAIPRRLRPGRCNQLYSERTPPDVCQ